MKHLRRLVCLGLLAALWGLVLGYIPLAQAQPAPVSPPENADDRIAALERKLRVLEQRLAFLEQQLGQDSKKLPASNGIVPVSAIEQRGDLVARALASAPSPAQTSQDPSQQTAVIAPVAAGQEGFSLRSPDGNFRLNLRYQMHLDGRFAADRDAAADPNTFYLRRAQPILDGTIFERFSFRVLTDFGLGKPRVNDAYVDAMLWPGLRVRAGKFKGPVGLERLMSGMTLHFVERSLPTQLVPNRDQGIQLFGDFRDGTLSYALGVFNGVPDIGSTDGDDDDPKEFQGRIFSHPFRRMGPQALQGLGWGIAGSYGSKEGTAGSPSLPEYQSTGKRTFFGYRHSGTVVGTVMADGAQYRLTPQGYYYGGPFGLLWEYVLSSQSVKRNTSRATIDNTSWQVAATYVLTGEKASYSGVLPARALDPAGGAWGAWELAARYSELHVDKDAFPLFADPQESARAAKAWALGLNWYLNRGVKVVFNYEQTDFMRAAEGVNFKKEKVFLERFQFRF